MASKTKRAAVEGYFTLREDDPRLIGSRCTGCGTYYFPAETLLCRHPECSSTELNQVELSTQGRLWSYTSASYPPPAPFVAKDPFEPFAIAAVQLEKEKLTVLGQVADGVQVDALRSGMPMQLVLSTLHEDEEHEYLSWQWKAVES